MVTFKAITKEEIGKMLIHKSHKRILGAIINEFINSNHEAIECSYEPGDYENANNFRKAFENIIKRNHYNDIYVTIRGSRVFLVKKDDLT